MDKVTNLLILSVDAFVAGMLVLFMLAFLAFSWVVGAVLSLAIRVMRLRLRFGKRYE